MPKGAIENFVGMSLDGSPLREAFASLAPHAVESVRNKILEGIALGYNPRKTASQIRQAFGSNAARALTITRTASLQAYREATRETYKRNSRIVHGWVWYASLTTRTCVVCWSMHGTVHSVEESLDSHANCRCTMLPYLSEKSAIETGADAFNKLSAKEQQEILGIQGYRKYQKGEVNLKSFVGIQRDAKYGITRYRNPLTKLKDIHPTKSFIESEKLAKALGFKDFIIENDYLNQKQQIADHFTEGLAELAKKYPRYGMPKKLIFTTNPPDAGWRAWYNAKDDALFVNIKHSVWQDIEYWMQEEGFKKFYSTANPFHIIRHEYGHFVHQVEQSKAMLKLELLPEEKRLIGNRVSLYAVTNSSEFVAEVFAGLVDGKFFNDKEILDLYNKYGGVIPK